MTEAYLNNPNLNKTKTITQFTDEQVKEIIKCYNDIFYFIENYVYIISLDEGRVQFKLYDYQKEMINTFDKNRFCIATLSRQMGKTITVSAFLLYLALFKKDYTIGILANKAEKAQEILSRIKMMFEELPLWLKPRCF